ncbi:MAG: N-acetyltransferase [Defluviitaleaceae bacterium]|nr:N-acetyltransferase [Defluviitaleaceae bacterium]
MELNLRLEKPTDHYAVEELTREAFWKQGWEAKPQICDEHLLVNRLRTCASFVPELNYVAEAHGKLAGHIIYTKSKIVNDYGVAHEMLTFGPLSVLPDYHGKGIGKALMLHTFGIAKQLGYRAIIIFGHPDYYPRVGFRRGAEFGLTTSEYKTFDPFMAYPLYDGALDGICGRYFIDPVYEDLKEEDVMAFDKKFPPKEMHMPIPVDVLLNRLKPEARMAIQGLGFEVLTMMQTKSQGEISALAGVDDFAVETIRGVMEEHGYRWGN